MTDPAIHVGWRPLAPPDDVQGVPVPVHLLYPTHAPARVESFGPYQVELARGAPPAGDRLPLVVVSHGQGGNPWGYRALAAHLVREGAAVALVAHPGDTRGDAALTGTAANLANRPRHLCRAVDASFADEAVGPRLVPGRAVLVGHSIGGYTALAAAGGRPMSMPGQQPDGVARPVPVEPDPRVRAVVLFGPALPWLMGPGALADVRVPVLARAGERDEMAPPYVIERILAGLPPEARLDYQVVPGAGHFAWLTPLPASMVSPDFPPSQDPPGFDRAAYQAGVLHGEVAAFVRAHG